MKNCIKCGVEIKNHVKFCYSCGEKQPIPDTQEESDKKACPKCGSELDFQIKFCPECGEKQYHEDSDVSEEAISILNFVEISSHPAKQWNFTKRAMEQYFFSFPFALAQKSGKPSERLPISDEQKGFVCSICNFLEHDDIGKNFLNINHNTVNTAIAALKKILKDDEQKFTWLLDLMFFDSLSDSGHGNTKIYSDLCRAFKINQQDDFIQNAATFFTNKSGEDFDLSVIGLQTRTTAWKHILEYRGLNLDRFLSGEVEILDNISTELYDIEHDLQMMHSELLNSNNDFILRLKKHFYYNKLNDKRKLALQLIENNEDFIFSVAFITKKFIPDAKLPDFSSEKNKLSSQITSSDSSLDWYLYFEIDPVTDTISSVSSCITRIISYIIRICRGEYK